MRLFFKIGSTLLTAGLAAWMMWMSFAPATTAERAALGVDFNRFNLTQMRLARTMMSVAPELTVAAFSQVTDIHPTLMAAHLNEKAYGRQDLLMSVPEPSALPEPDQPEAAPKRRIDAGGALFVRPD